MNNKPSPDELAASRQAHALSCLRGTLPDTLDLTLSEAIILGLYKQQVRTFFVVLGHGTTEIGEILRIYHHAGLVRVFQVRSEIEASHAATALRWVTAEKAAVVTSIGPGALQAMAASIVPSSDGIGVWYLLGDETTEDEGFNMQQIPRHEQDLFLHLAGSLGRAYSLHTPLALPTALQRGSTTVDHPYHPGPFFLLLPMNTQAAWLPGFNLRELPDECRLTLGPAQADYTLAAQWIAEASKIVVKVGGGGRNAGMELARLIELSAGVLVHTPIASGCIPYHHPQNMGVGGSKGSLCGNFAMENADLLIAVGTRAVCQSDCSRTGYPNIRKVININADINDATHYHDSLVLVGDVKSTLRLLIDHLHPVNPDGKTWLDACAAVKNDWQEFKRLRIKDPVLYDDYWKRTVLTQPAAIITALDWAMTNKVVCFFDAGDVQANGFQVAEPTSPGQIYTESGASYMGFAVSALLATGSARKPFYALAFSGDGSFTMNPQILIDGVEHGSLGCILLLDNGRMGAISGLQVDQYKNPFATWNTLQVDYLSWAKAVPGILAIPGGDSQASLVAALEQARAHAGLTLIHVPVYFGQDPMGGMGVYGRWNVGAWSDEVQKLRHLSGL